LDPDSPDGAAPGEASVIVKLSGVAVVVGLLAGLLAAAFIGVQHGLSHWLWHGLPEMLGESQAPWWLVIALPLIGAGLTAAAIRLPGAGGHGPLDGLSMDIGPREVASVVLAAVAGLSFGAVLGPEAPLIAIGTAAGAVVVRDSASPARQVMMIVGGMAAVGAIFGNPVVTAILLLEMATVAGPKLSSMKVLVPSLVGLAASYSLQVGVGPWVGLGESVLSLPGLPAYPSVPLVDVAWAIPVSLVAAALAVLALRGGTLWRRWGQSRPTGLLLASGAVVGVVAVVVTSVTGVAPTLVVMSGQTAMVDYLGLGSLGVALVVLAGKFVAYAVSLGGGFRGGQIFPAVAMATIVASTISIVSGDAVSAGLIAAAIAAAVAGAMRLPFTAVLLGVVLTISAGGAVAVLAIIGAVVGLVGRLAADHRWPTLMVAESVQTGPSTSKEGA
jgi:chloride channel protein, CIC family